VIRTELETPWYGRTVVTLCSVWLYFERVRAEVWVRFVVYISCPPGLGKRFFASVEDAQDPYR
jgi:hypothetical protein